MANRRSYKYTTVFRQVGSLIPEHWVAKLARKHGVKSRQLTPWSHVAAMLFAQLSHALGLNDICDALRHHVSALFGIRGASPPSRNGLSFANMNRPAEMAEELFWEMLRHLEASHPQFGGRAQGYSRLPRRFRRTIQAVDSSTISLVANCMDWARHRRRKAAAKLHMRLNLSSYLPAFAIVDTAKHNDNKRARELCAGLQAGEIAVFDKAYLDFEHLYDLSQRVVFWVIREKDNLQLRKLRTIANPHGKILADEEVVLVREESYENYPMALRRVRALVEIDNQEVEMTFLTNNMEWAGSSIAELYRCRWGIEAFFKQIKQTLQLRVFVGYSKNAIQWQVWTALLTYILLRYLAVLSQWPHSFIRIYTLTRALLWSCLDLPGVLKSYGTARSARDELPVLQQLYLPGFCPVPQ